MTRARNDLVLAVKKQFPEVLRFEKFFKEEMQMFESSFEKPTSWYLENGTPQAEGVDLSALNDPALSATDRHMLMV